VTVALSVTANNSESQNGNGNGKSTTAVVPFERQQTDVANFLSAADDETEARAPRAEVDGNAAATVIRELRPPPITAVRTSDRCESVNNVDLGIAMTDDDADSIAESVSDDENDNIGRVTASSRGTPMTMRSARSSRADERHGMSASDRTKRVSFTHEFKEGSAGDLSGRRVASASPHAAESTAKRRSLRDSGGCGIPITRTTSASEMAQILLRRRLIAAAADNQPKVPRLPPRPRTTT
jgi:hypothetical protein